jgi:ankyrin repeat protein
MAQELVNAAMSGKTADVERLIKSGADKEAAHKGSTAGSMALICAARFGSAECVRLLLDAGVDKNHKDDDGNTALDLAKEDGRVGIVRLIESHVFAAAGTGK